MAAKADARMGTPADPAAAPAAEPARPAGLPEKFKTVEDLVKSYSELEKKLGAAPAAPAGAPAKVDPIVPPAAPAQAAEAVKAAGLDVAALNAELAEKGDLSPETRTKLEAAGYNKQMVDGYLEGQRAIAAKYATAAHEAAGGADKYKSMVAWAGTNFSADEIAAFNAATDSGNPAQLKLAVQALRGRYEAAEGSDPGLISGGGNAPTVEAFESNAQMSAAIRDPRYKTDPAYRAQVEKKIHAMK